MAQDTAVRGRREDRRLVTGTGTYVGDLSLPGMAHAVVVRSQIAHGRIERIDTEAATGMPGVLGVFTAADLAADGLTDLPGPVEMKRPDGMPAPVARRLALARDKVRFVGEAVAVVVAETREAAQNAAEQVLVDVAELPAAVTPAQALAAGAPAVWDTSPDNIAFGWSKGDMAAVDAALAASAHVTRLSTQVSRVNANSMEPRGAVGAVEAGGRLVLHASHQSPYAMRTALAGIFKVPADMMRVIVRDVGGSFGMKAGVYPEDVLVLWCARKLGRPVRWIADRLEGFLSDEHARDIAFDAALGLDPDGNFTALQVKATINIGCFLSGRSMGLLNNIGGISGVYRTPVVAAEVKGVLTNTQVTAPYRGAGRPEATYILERLIDIAARETGRDPFALRKANLVSSSAMPYTTSFIFTYDCGDFARNMDDAARLADITGFPARRRDAEARGRLRGIGLANPIEVAGGPFLKPGKDNAEVQVGSDGSITLNTGVMSVGQGLETTLSTLVAERLGVGIDKVTFNQGDTEQLAFGRGSGGSSGWSVGGTAVSGAIDKVIDTARKQASEMLETSAGDIDFKDGRFTVVGTDRSVALAEVARRIEQRTGKPLAETAEFQPTKVTFPNGAHVCEVEVDPATGETEIVRYTVVEDVGRIMNEALVRGQIHGGIAQGVGQALGEAMVHDEGSGQLLTATFMDYVMPRADDLPAITIATNSVPTEVNALGAKGVGEAGTVGSLVATINAVCDALAPLGVRHIEMPATPHRVWSAIRDARAKL